MNRAIVFQTEPLTTRELELHEKAIAQAQIYLRSEAELLETIMAVDKSRFFLKLGLGSTFAYCLKVLKLSPAVTSNFINVGSKSQVVPELKVAV
jgi:hypothetical protein